MKQNKTILKKKYHGSHIDIWSKKQHIECLKELQKEEIIDFYEKYVLNVKNGNVRCVICQVHCDEKAFNNTKYEMKPMQQGFNIQNITHLMSFKRQCMVCPSVYNDWWN